MRVCYLHKKRLNTSRDKAQSRRVNSFVDIEKQQAVCQFTIAIRSLISKKELSKNQANSLMTQLIDLFSITSADIDSSRTSTTSRKRLETQWDNIIQLKKMGIPMVEFEDHLKSLETLHHEESLQEYQGLVIATLLLRHYPKTGKLLSRQDQTFQKRGLAVN